MVKKTDDSKPEPQTFMITVVPVNSHITTDNIESKLRLMMGGIGLKSVDVECVNKPGQPD